MKADIMRFTGNSKTAASSIFCLRPAYGFSQPTAASSRTLPVRPSPDLAVAAKVRSDGPHRSGIVLCSMSGQGRKRCFSKALVRWFHFSMLLSAAKKRWPYIPVSLCGKASRSMRFIAILSQTAFQPDRGTTPGSG